MSFGPSHPKTYDQAGKPSNYVAGIGRGASGFTTRSDIGPAGTGQKSLTDVSFGAAPVGYVAGRGRGFGQQGTGEMGAPAPDAYVAGRGRGMGELAREQGELSSKQTNDDMERVDYSESNYDSFSGYSEGLFAGGNYEDDDREADLIYQSVDQCLEKRHKRSRELQLLADSQKKQKEAATISEQFADLKQGLSEVSSEMWDAIPEVGDHSLKTKMQRKNKGVSFMPLPDSVVTQAGASGVGLSGNTLASVDVSGDAGAGTPAGGAITGLSGARGTVLSLKLDRMSDSVSGQTVVDPRGYLTEMSGIKISSSAEVGDIKKARTLLGSVTSTNPKHAPGWIAAARVEEFAGKIVQARKIIRQGCEACPDAEDVWLEAARLHGSENAKTILANAVRQIPNSVNIWSKAAQLEDSDEKKKVVLRKALEVVPSSVELWKAAIELESTADARIMLSHAVECVPQSVEMWITLAKLETYDNARKVLNMAREANPQEELVWITAARLEEANGNAAAVHKILEKAVASLQHYGVVLDRIKWLREAETCETLDAPATCAAIVHNTVGLGVDEEDQLRTWLDDADTCLEKRPPMVRTARAIYEHALQAFSEDWGLWMASCVLEKEHGDPAVLQAQLERAVTHCPQAEVLWLMAAKEKWAAGDVAGSRALLTAAFEANPNSEKIWLAAIKLEWENGEAARAALLLGKAREKAPSPRVWMKSAVMAEEMGEIEACLRLADQAIQRYPTFTKLYMLAGQASERSDGGIEADLARARGYYQAGLAQSASAPADAEPLWLLLAALEERHKGAARARSTLEMARLKLPASERVWLESVRLERRSGSEQLATSLGAKALRACPKSPMLWADELLHCPKTKQKSVSFDALSNCDNDVTVITAVARLFERDRKVSKARKWFDRAVSVDPDAGDAWIFFFAFECGLTPTGATRSPEAEQVLARCVVAAPSHGEVWTRTAKSLENRRKRLSKGQVLETAAARVLLEE